MNPEVVESLMAIPGIPYDIFSQCLWIEVGDAAADAALELDEYNGGPIRKALTIIPGSNWMISMDLNGKCVWRQEAVTDLEAGSTEQLFLFWRDHGDDSGWYIATRVFNTDEEKQAVGEDNIIGFLHGNDFPDSAIHIPYWRRKPFSDEAKLSPWAPMVIEQAQALQSAHDILNEAVDGVQAQRAENATKHGGWMEKAAKIASVIWKGKWEAATVFINREYYGSEKFRMLANKAYLQRPARAG